MAKAKKPERSQADYTHLRESVVRGASLEHPETADMLVELFDEILIEATPPF